MAAGSADGQSPPARSDGTVVWPMRAHFELCSADQPDGRTMMVCLSLVSLSREVVRSEADPHRELRSFPPSAGMACKSHAGQKPKLERWWAIDLWVKVLVASIVRVGLLGKAKFPNSLNSISTWFGFRTSDFRIQISLSAL